MFSFFEADDLIQRRSIKNVVDFTYKVVGCIFFLVEFGKFLVGFIIKKWFNWQDKHKPRYVDDLSPQKEDFLQPFEEKLKQLEELVLVLSSKPSKIPQEKDEILVESLNRIRSMEYDLQKTKKVWIFILSRFKCKAIDFH